MVHIGSERKKKVFVLIRRHLETKKEYRHGGIEGKARLDELISIYTNKGFEIVSVTEEEISYMPVFI